MKLNGSQVEAIERKTGFKPLPEEAAKESGLTEALGDHTFYVDPNGIYVFEPIEDETGTGDPVRAVQVAEVEKRDGSGDEVVVSAIEPQETELTIDLAG